MRVLFGVGGGIAAYKAADVVSRLCGSGADVRVVLTEAATHLVAPATFAALTGHPALTDLFAATSDGWTIPHVALADWAEYAVVAPATADLVGRLALGLGDDLLTTALLAFPGPVVLAPAMNRFMWAHPAVQRNLASLQGFGYQILPPRYGRLAEGAEGWGRMVDTEAIVAALRALSPRQRAGMPPPPLAGMGVLVTAGPTWEHLDAVRLLTNASSGRMGWALAEAAAASGARVTLVAGPTALPDPAGVSVVRVRTAREMEAAVNARYADCQIVLAAAAVADWRPAEVLPTKLKKEARGGEVTLRLVPNPDILAGLGADKGHRILVGFALEAGSGPEEARRKLHAKHLDLIVYNETPALGADENRVIILAADGTAEEVGPAPKDVVAARILDRVTALVNGRSGRT